VVNKPSSVLQKQRQSFIWTAGCPTALATHPEGQRAASYPSLFGLAPCGVYQASQSPGCWCALTAPFHPCRQAKPA